MNRKHLEERRLKRALQAENDPSKKVTMMNRLRTVKHKNHPPDIQKGDIVHVKMGVNVGDELSDLDHGLRSIPGHYGIVLAQRGFMFLILPLTSQPQRLNDPEMELYLDDLDLPGSVSRSYLAFAKIKFVHIRRIKRIHGLQNGKVRINNPELMKQLDEKLLKLLAIQIPLPTGNHPT